MEVRRNDREEVIWRRAWRYAAVFTVLLHVGVVLLFRERVVIPDVAEAAAGERAGDDQAAEGGGMRALSLRIEIPPPPKPIPRPPEPLPVPEDVVVPVVEPDPQPPQPTQGTQATGTGEGQGTKTGPGVAGGTGRGDGGEGDEGLYRVSPPTPRGLILPPSDRPGKVRGKEVVVYVFVTTRGRVVADSTRLAPSTGDRKFDERLRRQASEWVFNPARRAGQPIAEWFKYTIVL